MTTVQYESPEMTVSLFDAADVLTTSGGYYGDGDYKEHDTGNLGEEDNLT